MGWQITTKRMLLIIGFMFLLAFVAGMASAKGVEASVRWQPADKYEDGTPMPQAEIAEYELHWSVGEKLVEMKEPLRLGIGARNDFTLDLDLKPRAEPYKVNIGLKTVSIYGAKSDMSNVVSQTFTVSNPAKPNAPVNIKLEIRCDETCEIVKQTVAR